MINNKLIIAFLAISIIFSSCSEKIVYNDSKKNPIDTKVDSLLSLMTLKEKIGQMTQINLTVISKGPNKWGANDTMEIDFNKAKRAIVDYNVGSVLNTVNNESSTASEDLEITYNGDDIEIGFNSKYIMDIVNNLEDEEISIILKDNTSPIIALENSNSNLVYVLMPMRV